MKVDKREKLINQAGMKLRENEMNGVQALILVSQQHVRPDTNYTNQL